MKLKIHKEIGTTVFRQGILMIWFDKILYLINFTLQNTHFSVTFFLPIFQIAFHYLPHHYAEVFCTAAVSSSVRKMLVYITSNDVTNLYLNITCNFK